MQPSSSEFAAAITSYPQVMCAKAEIWKPPPNPECLYSPLIVSTSGPSMTDDETSVTRRTAQLTVLDPTGALTPSEATDLLHPLSNNEIRLFRGLELTNGPEYIPCGVYRLTSPVATNRTDGGLSIELKLDDRMERLTHYGWLDPFVVQGNITEILYNTLEGFMTGLEYNFDLVNYVVTEIPPLVWGGVGSYTANQTTAGGAGETDPASGMTDLATVQGMELFFDAAGVAMFRSITAPALQPPSFFYRAGPGCMAESVPRTLDVSNWYNTVVVDGGSATMQSNVQAIAYLPPKPSPCIPYSYTSPSIVSIAQAYSCALGILYRLNFSLESVAMTAIPDPRLNAGDVARLDFPASRIAGLYVAENVQMPFDAKSKMTVKWRPVQLVGVDTFGLPAGV